MEVHGRLGRMTITSLAVCLLAAAGAAWPQADSYVPATPLTGTLTARTKELVRTWLQANVQLGPSQGYELAVVVNGQVAFEYASGQAAGGTGMTPATVMPLASLSKMFTAAAILKLASDEKLSTEADLSDIVSGMSRSVTIGELLSHTSGLPDYVGKLGPDEGQAPIPSSALIQRYLAFAGEDSTGQGSFAYSNGNFILLGRVIELKSGMTYGEFLKSKVLKPAGLSRTEYSTAPLAAHASGAPEYQSSWAFAAGGIRSTAGETALWMNQLVRGKILSQEWTNEMLTPRVVMSGTDDSYCYGLMRRDGTDFPSVYHNGRIPGFDTLVVTKLYPDDPVTVCILTDVYPASNLEAVATNVLAMASTDTRFRRCLARIYQDEVDDSQLAPMLAAAIQDQGSAALDEIGPVTSCNLKEMYQRDDGGVQASFETRHGGTRLDWVFTTDGFGIIDGLAFQAH